MEYRNVELSSPSSQVNILEIVYKFGGAKIVQQ